LGDGDAEQDAKLGEEHRVVGALGRAGVFPAADERLNGVFCECDRTRQAAPPD